MNVLLMALVTLTASAGAPVPVADFAKPPSVEAMKLSPDGRYLGLVVPQGDYETSLLVLDVATLKPVGGMKSA